MIFFFFFDIRMKLMKIKMIDFLKNMNKLIEIYEDQSIEKDKWYDKEMIKNEMREEKRERKNRI